MAETKKTADKSTDKSDDAPFYCPGCGRRFNYMTACRGMSDTAPHPEIEVVSTDEIGGDKETAAPDTGGEKL